MKKYYELLGIDSNVDDMAVKKAYREQINKEKDNPTKVRDIKEAYKNVMNDRIKPVYEYDNINKNTKSKYSNIVDMIMESRFADAIKMLTGINENDEQWHYLYATANYGIGNNINASKHLRFAYEMADDKNSYDQMYQRDNVYNNRVNNGRYRNNACFNSVCCCDSCCCDDSCCDACCKLYCADTLCECMGGDLCECF